MQIAHSAQNLSKVIFEFRNWVSSTLTVRSALSTCLSSNICFSPNKEQYFAFSLQNKEVIPHERFDFITTESALQALASSRRTIAVNHFDQLHCSTIWPTIYIVRSVHKFSNSNKSSTIANVHTFQWKYTEQHTTVK